MQINEGLVKRLIIQQFPEWQNLPIRAVAESGWDNRTFHLGDEMLVRLPKDAEHAPPILKEYKWLTILAKKISIPITIPVALGHPSEIYPWHWVVNSWLAGSVASHKSIKNLNAFAKSLGEFLREFQSIDTTDGPKAGTHNFFRGGLLNVYDSEVRDAISKIINPQQKVLATRLWEHAISTEWQGLPVWVHGDLAVGNILVNDGKLSGIIDFGQLAVGEPACDLVIAWNFLSGESRDTFKNTVGLDKDTWIRAMGWVLWKTLCHPVKGTDVKSVLQDIYSDYQDTVS